MKAFMSLLKGFEVREIVCIFDSTAHVKVCHVQIVAPETLVAVENGGKQRIVVPSNNPAALICRWRKVRWLAGLVSLLS